METIQTKNLRQSKSDQAGKKYRILSLEEKQKIMKVLQYNCTLETLSLLSCQYNTSIKNLRRWHNEGIERKPGCGRKKLNLEAEKKLCVWIIDQSVKQGRRVRRSQLREQAISLFNDKFFKASKAWQDEFIRNYDVKYQVNEILYRKGMLNSLQKQKFLEMQARRNGVGSDIVSENQKTQEQQIEQNQVPTEIKTEDVKQFCTVSQFCQDDYSWGQDFEVKFEESYHNYNVDPPLQISIFHEDSWDYKINQEVSQVSQSEAFNNTKKNKKKFKKSKNY